MHEVKNLREDYVRLSAMVHYLLSLLTQPCQQMFEFGLRKETLFQGTCCYLYRVPGGQGVLQSPWDPSLDL
jgi:hypothetical protein